VSGRSTYKERTGLSRQRNWQLRKKGHVLPVKKPCWYCEGGIVLVYPDGRKPPQCFDCKLPEAIANTPDRSLDEAGR